MLLASHPNNLFHVVKHLQLGLLDLWGPEFQLSQCPQQDPENAKEQFNQTCILAIHLFQTPVISESKIISKSSNSENTKSTDPECLSLDREYIVLPTMFQQFRDILNKFVLKLINSMLSQCSHSVNSL